MKLNHLYPDSPFKLIAALLFLLPALSFSQGIYNNGASIVLYNDPDIHINGSSGNYRSEAGGILQNSHGYFTMTMGGNWINNSGNSGFSHPGSTVILNGSAAQSIEGTGSTAFYYLKASGAGLKTVSSPASVSYILNVDGSTMDANGKLTLKASAEQNANVAPLLNNAHITGNVNVEAYFTGGAAKYRGSRALSSPINDNIAVTNTYQQLKNYMIITGSGSTANGFDAGSTSTTLNKYNEPAKVNVSQFTPVANINEKLLPGRGVFLLFRGNRDNFSGKMVSPFPVPESVLMNYFGPINQGNVTVNLSYTNNTDSAVVSGTVRADREYNGYNLVGNPYPCTINWDLVSKDPSMVHNELIIPKSSGGYRVFKNGIQLNGFDYNVTEIMAGMGFYVRAKAPGASITFTEDSKVPEAAPERLLVAPGNSETITLNGFSPSYVPKPVKRNNKVPQLRLKLSDNLGSEETVAVFGNQYSSKADGDDATFFGGSTITLSTLSSDSKALSINFMNDLSKVQELRLSIDATATKNVDLKFTDMSALTGYQVLLMDTFKDSIINVWEANSYSFMIDKAVPASYGNKRLILLFNKPEVLSDEVLSLTAKRELRGSELSWQTNRQNVSKFEVERSADGVSFHKIGEVQNVQSQGNYLYLDNTPLSGINSYRLRLFDKEGRYTFSKIVSINYPEVQVAYSLYPNPATDRIFINAPERKSTVILNIIDIRGKQVKKTKVAAHQPLEENVSTLLPGVYVLQVINEDTSEVAASIKFVKN